MINLTNGSFISATPYIQPDDLELYIVTLNATLHLPWAFEPVVHWAFDVMNWIGGYA